MYGIIIKILSINTWEVKAMRKVTLKDVAQETGFSTATISRVINGNYPVSENTRKIVLDAIDELGYVPNAVAKSLKESKTDTIGVIVPDISNPYFMNIVKGMEDVVGKEGYSLLMGSTHDKIENEVELLELFHERRVEAIILATCQIDNKYIETFLNRGIKLLMIDRMILGVKTLSIILNNYEASYEITKYIINNNHKKIMLVNGDSDIWTEKQRYKGFLKALEDHGIEVKPEFVFRDILSREEAYKAIPNALKDTNQLPTAIYCTNHYLVEGVLLSLKELKVKLPEKMSIVSFGKTRAPKLIKPKLTHISYNSFKIGQFCGKIVLEMMNRKLKNRERVYRVNAEICEGDSVKKL